jgi:hypothetical protein
MRQSAARARDGCPHFRTSSHQRERWRGAGGRIVLPCQFGRSSRPTLADAGIEPERAPDGGVGIWLDRATVAKLRAMRGPGEDYSDVIWALAEADAGR